MSHLDLARWQDLLSGRLAAGETEVLRSHLAQGCERCEQLIAEAAQDGEPDALDGLVDEALIELGPAAAEQGLDELGYARVQRALRGQRARPWIAGLGALAAAAAVALVLLPTEQASWRFKGGAVALPAAQLELLAVVDGQPDALARGASVEPGTSLVFRVRLDQPGCVQLWQRGAGALLDAPLCLPVGDHVLARDGQPLGFTAELSGTLEFELRLGAEAGAETRAIDDPRSRFTLEVGRPRAGSLP